MKRTQRRRKRPTKSTPTRQQPLNGHWILFALAAILLFGLGTYGYLHWQTPVDTQYFRQLAREHQDYYMEHQEAIVQAIEVRDVDPMTVGYLMIPENPAQYVDIAHVPQYEVPYLNQHDAQWGRQRYGTDGSRQMWENGCAIVSLAMVDAYFRSQPMSPQALAKWAGDTYYMEGQGTAWSVYSAFAQAYDYELVDVGNDFHHAMDYLEAGYLIVVAVGPGTFTPGGHVMVVRGYDGTSVYINDPNDSPKTYFSIRPIPAQTLIEDSMNYWALRPE